MPALMSAWIWHISDHLLPGHCTICAMTNSGRSISVTVTKNIPWFHTSSWPLARSSGQMLIGSQIYCTTVPLFRVDSVYRTWSDFKQTKNTYTHLSFSHTFFGLLTESGRTQTRWFRIVQAFLCARPMASLSLCYVLVVSICWYSFHFFASLLNTQLSANACVINAPPPACLPLWYIPVESGSWRGRGEKTKQGTRCMRYQHTERAPQRALHYVLTTRAAH